MKKIVMVLGVMSLMACGSGKNTVPFSSLEGEWQVVEVNNAPVSAEEVPFLGFNVAEKQLYGNAGCNSVMGSIVADEAQPGVLSFDALGSTKRMCADMTAEDAILQALGAVKGYDLTDGKLTLTDADGKELMELSKK